MSGRCPAGVLAAHAGWKTSALGMLPGLPRMMGTDPFRRLQEPSAEANEASLQKATLHKIVQGLGKQSDHELLVFPPVREISRNVQ